MDLEVRKIEKELSAINWWKIFVEKSYPSDAIDRLMTEYYGADWKNCLPEQEEAVE